MKTYQTSTDPDYEAKKNPVLELYAIADGKAAPGPDDPTAVFCMDEFGPLNLQPHPGKQWAPVAAGKGDPAAPRRRRRRATYKRPHGVRHLLAGYDLSVIGSMLAGGDHIDHRAVLRAGVTGSLFDLTGAPSTVGTWLRAHKGATELHLPALEERDRLVPGAAGLARVLADEAHADP